MTQTPAPDLRAEAVREAFLARYGTQARLFRAPGRINLIGEHTDYNDGFVMPMNTGLYTWVAMDARDDRILRVTSTQFDETLNIDLDQLDAASDGAWGEYVKGVAWALLEEGLVLAGADLLIDGDLPVGGGLSSSASLELAVASALLARIDTEVHPVGLAKACRRAENEFVGVNCGIMDQFVIAAAPSGHAIRLDCRNLGANALSLPEDLEILVVDSGVRHALSDGQFNQRRQDCMEAVVGLSQAGEARHSLRDYITFDLVRARSRLTPRQYNRARHVLEENHRVTQAQLALGEPDIEWLGRLVDQSHASLRDLYEVSCTELDQLTDIARTVEGVLGARMVGGGFGGCAIILMLAQHADAATARIVEQYGEWHGSLPWHHRVTPAEPAGEYSA